MDLNQINRDSDPHNVQYLLSVLRETTEVQVDDVPDQQRIESSYPHAGPSSSSSGSRSAAQGPASVRGVDPRKRRVLPPPPAPPPEEEEVEVGSKQTCVLPMSPPRSPLQQAGSTTTPHAPNTRRDEPIPTSSPSPSTVQPPPDPDPNPNPNLSHLPSSQALPHLQKLVSSALFLRALMTLKREQDELERSLQREWNAMQTSTTPHAQERERWKAAALRRWDLVQHKQQIRLMELKTPGFYPTKSPSARANQRKILDLLSGLIEGG